MRLVDAMEQRPEDPGTAALLGALRRLAAMAVADDGEVFPALESALREVLGASEVRRVLAGGDPPEGVDPEALRCAIERMRPVVGAHGSGRAVLVVPVAHGAGEAIAIVAESLDEREMEIALTLIDQAAAAEAARSAREAARVDPLTGILNHGAMQSALREEAARAARAGTPLSCLMVDLDHFKTVNDRYGHVVGDLVLQRVAAALRRGRRPYDRVCRYGGDEFVVLMPAADLASATVAAERIRVDVAEALRGDPELDLRLAASVGIAEWAPGEDPVDLLRAADKALLDAKHEGRDAVRHASGRFRRE